MRSIADSNITCYIRTDEITFNNIIIRVSRTRIGEINSIFTISGDDIAIYIIRATNLRIECATDNNSVDGVSCISSAVNVESDNIATNYDPITGVNTVSIDQYSIASVG